MVEIAAGFVLGLLVGMFRNLVRARYSHLCDLWNVTVMTHSRKFQQKGYPLMTAHKRRTPYRIRVGDGDLVVRDVRPSARMFHTYRIPLEFAEKTWERRTQR